jgi:CRP-like cAMP-binding protein
LSDGDALFWTGEEADYIYLLIQGELAINSEINGQLVLLNYLHPGALVGEAAMEADGKRMATVIANQDCQLIRFTPDELFQAFEKHGNLLPHFLKEMMVRKNTSKLSNSPLFSQLPMDLRFIIANRIQVNHFKAGSILSTSSHENNDKATMIVDGIVHLYDESQTGSRIYCGRLSTGDMFDISPLLHALPIGLLYIAETPCEVLHIGFNVIRDVMQISKRFRLQLEKDTSTLTAQLTQTVLLQHKS